jgi:predicted RNase H-like HicB family nuclease
VKYAVVFERSAANYSAYVPDLPGCVATGRTRQEVEQRVREAIRMHLDALRAEKEPIPQPQSWTELVEA